MKHIKNFRTDEEYEKLNNVTKEYKHRCKCGASVVIYPFEKKVSKVCKYCGELIFINDKEKFKYKLSKEIKKLQEDKWDIANTKQRKL